MIEKKFSEKIDVLSKYLSILHKTEPIRKSGKVIRVSGNVIYSQGPPDSKVGEIMDVERMDKKGYLQCEIIGFDGHKYALMPLGETEGIYPKASVFSSGKKLTLPVGHELLGRVINGAAKPIDGKGILVCSDERYPENDPINPLERPLITKVLTTGVRAIDGLLTVGRGQRIGIFSGSGVGKSSLLGMISRYTNADINIVALVGERGREVNEFLELELGIEALQKTIVFVATSDAPKMQQLNCALLATSAAEYFRDKGYHVNLMMDSLTRFAHAAREISISYGEPSITRGFSASVFARLAKLVERSGTSPTGGTITGFYTILTEPDDMNDPIADAVRGYLDGHIVLNRKLAEMNHYPAIDIPASLSRVMQKVVKEDHYMYAGFIRELINAYNLSEETIKLAAYVKGSDPRTDLAISNKEAIDNYLKQRIEVKSTFQEAVSKLREITMNSQADD
jgi:flagellum-specific ATP synthase